MESRSSHQEQIELDIRRELISKMPMMNYNAYLKLPQIQGSNKIISKKALMSSNELLVLEINDDLMLPIFQFDRDYKIIEVVSQVISALQPSTTNWGIMNWLTQPNGSLDDSPPIFFIDKPKKLLEALEHELEKAEL